MNRQRLALFILVIIFVIAALWSYSAMPRLKTIDTATEKPVATVRLAATVSTPHVAGKDDGSVLHLGLLEKPSASFTGYRRNIFKPFYADEMKKLKQQAAPIPLSPKAPVTTPVLPVAAQPVAAPLARFTFLGFLKKGMVKTIFLAKDKDIILVKKGDVIAGRYEVTEISDQELSLRALDYGDEIVIPLIENHSLANSQ